MKTIEIPLLEYIELLEFKLLHLSNTQTDSSSDKEIEELEKQIFHYKSLLVMKTVREWFETLKNPYKDNAISNTPEDILDCEEETLSDALMRAFNWSESKEGSDYWMNVYKYPSKSVKTK